MRPSTPSRPSVSRSSARRILTIDDFGWCPIRSNRKPSTLYSVAQVSTESIISFSIMACSVAVLAQQVDVSTCPVVAFSRW